MATCWAGKEDWTVARKKNTPEEKYMFVTFILNKMKLSTEHRKTKKKDKEKRLKEKTPRNMGPKHNSIHTRSEGPTVQLCGESNVARKWINSEFGQGIKYKETSGKIQKTMYSWWKRRIANPISNIDSFVNHVYREHNQEADHWANVATQGNRKIVMDRRDATTTWKAIRGFWDGSFKNNGRNECGIVIKGVDREKWVTISKTAVPLKVGAAMAAEIAGLCLLTSILDLILCKCLSVQNINQRIHRILNI